VDKTTLDALATLADSGALLVIIFCAALWFLLWLLVPFFIYGTNRRAKETSEKLDKVIDLLQRQLHK
jgi:hypothetical protein